MQYILRAIVPMNYSTFSVTLLSYDSYTIERIRVVNGSHASRYMANTNKLMAPLNSLKNQHVLIFIKQYNHDNDIITAFINVTILLPISEMYPQLLI